MIYHSNGGALRPINKKSEWGKKLLSEVLGLPLHSTVHHSDSCCLLYLVHSRLNPLECLLCLGMTILVWVKLLRQFTIKLGELGGLHLFHARYEHFRGRVQELVDNVDLIAL